MSFSIEPLALNIHLQPWSSTSASNAIGIANGSSSTYYKEPQTMPAPSANMQSVFAAALRRLDGSSPTELIKASGPPPSPLNFNYFGGDRASLAAEANAWLWQNGARGDTLIGLNQFMDTCRQKYFRPEHKALCFTVRIERESTKFDIPNPHYDGADGKYWDAQPGDGEMFKLGTVLLGPGTVFYNIDEEDENTANEARWALTAGRKEKLDEGWSHRKIRKWIAKAFENLDTTMLRPGEIGKWRVGNDCKGAIHSEPKMSDMPEGRIFVSVVPGTVEQIKELAKRWDVKYEVHDEEILFN